MIAGIPHLDSSRSETSPVAQNPDGGEGADCPAASSPSVPAPNKTPHEKAIWLCAVIAPLFAAVLPVTEAIRGWYEARAKDQAFYIEQELKSKELKHKIEMEFLTLATRPCQVDPKTGLCNSGDQYRILEALVLSAEDESPLKRWAQRQIENVRARIKLEVKSQHGVIRYNKRDNPARIKWEDIHDQVNIAESRLKLAVEQVEETTVRGLAADLRALQTQEKEAKEAYDQTLQTGTQTIFSATKLTETLGLAVLAEASLTLWVPTDASFSEQVNKQFLTDFPNSRLVKQETSLDELTATESGKDRDTYPDIGFISNYQQLRPLLDRHAIWTGWGESRFGDRGWWVIFKASKHIEQAQAFIRWLARSPAWQPANLPNMELTGEQTQAVQQKAIDAFNGLIAGNETALGSTLDTDAGRYRWPIVSGMTASATQAILTFGNDRFAFVVLSSVVTSEKTYGVRHVSFILRNQENRWAVLWFSDTGLAQVERLVQGFSDAISGNHGGAVLPKAVLASPADGSSVPRRPSKPNIEWTQVKIPGLSFLLEYAFNQPGHEAWSAGYLTFLDAEPDVREIPGQINTQTFSTPMPFGIGAQPHRWRIWSLDESGDLSVSGWRTINFTN
jgi:hypothetical protein